MEKKSRYKAIKIFGKNSNEIFIKDTKNNCYINNEDTVVEILNEQNEKIQQLIKNDNEFMLKILHCIATAKRGWTDEQNVFMKGLEKRLFPEE